MMRDSASVNSIIAVDEGERGRRMVKVKIVEGL